ncbi:MAG TPA: hypothetical protein VK425_12890 [Acidimicrobiales bacterium]|nr:hypothetical protein [Acidimicrobiales bacterium]
MGGEHADAERRWKAYVVPEAARLRTVLDERTRSVEVLTADNERRAERSGRLAELRATLGGDAHQFAAGLGSYRDHLDVTGSQAPSMLLEPLTPHFTRQSATISHPSGTTPVRSVDPLQASVEGAIMYTRSQFSLLRRPAPNDAEYGASLQEPQ